MARIVSEKIADVVIERKAGKTLLMIKLAPEIEELFRNSVANQVIKTKCATNEFNWYPVPNTTGKFKKWSQKFILNRPDGTIDIDKVFNFSYIFTQGTGKGIELTFTDLFSRELLDEYAKQMDGMLKEIYNEYISDLSIEHTMRVKTVTV